MISIYYLLSREIIIASARSIAKSLRWQAIPRALLSSYNETIPKQLGNDSAPIPSTNETSGRLAPAPFCPWLEKAGNSRELSSLRNLWPMFARTQRRRRRPSELRAERRSRGKTAAHRFRTLCSRSILTLTFHCAKPDFETGTRALGSRCASKRCVPRASRQVCPSKDDRCSLGVVTLAHEGASQLE